MEVKKKFKPIDPVYSEDEYRKLGDAFMDSMVYCKCGHSQQIKPSRDKGICKYCNRTVYNHSKARLRFLMLTDKNLLSQFSKGE